MQPAFEKWRVAGNEWRATYQKLHEFVVEQGVELTGIAYEMYIDDPGVTPEPELRTLIMFPLKQMVNGVEWPARE